MPIKHRFCFVRNGFSAGLAFTQGARAEREILWATPAWLLALGLCPHRCRLAPQRLAIILWRRQEWVEIVGHIVNHLFGDAVGRVGDSSGYEQADHDRTPPLI
ncbi:exported hypothetical protein [Mesorhizobium sp. STM 4661]|nr:exported hypothetical protein [Mesorhizobium sp. STM 4661]